MSNFLYGKLCVVSGASSGIGRSISRLLITKYGCSVIGIARNEERLSAIKRELGESFNYRVADVTTNECWENLAFALKDETRPVLLINNAGILPKFGRFSMHSREETEKTMNTNFGACVKSTRTLLPVIERTGGGIVNISSADALAALAGTSIYSASKAAAKAFTESLCEELRGSVYVGLVCPGFTKTPLLSAQNTQGRSNIVFRFATDSDVMARRILRGINRRKTRMVYGGDAHLMDIFSRIMPARSLRLFALFIKKSNLEIFEDVF